MSSDDKFYSIDRAAVQYELLLGVLGVDLKSATAEYFRSLQLPSQLERAVQPFIGMGSAAIRASLDFSDALEKYWQAIPVKDELKMELQKIANK
ncbi:hypothetical protein HY488_00610 [Candidatus Woesearchaeota archaeon]|nr:hypothetical protein [Candidatus Woesearchaeota archaeon]